jgi:hypothetical protein
MKYTMILETAVHYEGGQTHGPYHVVADNRQQAEDAALDLYVEEYKAR